MCVHIDSVAAVKVHVCVYTQILLQVQAKAFLEELEGVWMCVCIDSVAAAKVYECVCIDCVAVAKVHA